MEKYRQLEGATVDDDQDIFESTAAALREEGVALKTLAEMKQVCQKYTRCKYKATNLSKYELVLVLVLVLSCLNRPTFVNTVLTFVNSPGIIKKIKIFECCDTVSWFRLCNTLFTSQETF